MNSGPERTYWVYILASKRNGTLYVGTTNNLARRGYEHRTESLKGFTQKYGVHSLVYYEACNAPETAISREKQLKKWNRAWKIRLIEKDNPLWRDLYEELNH